MKKGEIILQPQTEASRRLRDRNKDVIRLQSRYLIRIALQSLRYRVGAFLKSGLIDFRFHKGCGSRKLWGGALNLCSETSNST